LEIRARVFQAGPLRHSASFDEADGLVYIHVQQRGALGRRISRPSTPVDRGAQPVLLHEPAQPPPAARDR
jgi:hypothetical protein